MQAGSHRALGAAPRPRRCGMGAGRPGRTCPAQGKRKRGAGVRQTPQSSSAKRYLGQKAINAPGHPSAGDRECVRPLPQHERLGRLLWAEPKLPVCHLPSVCSGQGKPGRATEVQEAQLHFGHTLHPPLGLGAEKCRSQEAWAKKTCVEPGSVGLEVRCSFKNRMKHPVVYPNRGAWLWSGKARM